jgi:hypothetical protein
MFDWIDTLSDRAKGWLLFGVLAGCVVVIGLVDDPADHEPIVDAPIVQVWP